MEVYNKIMLYFWLAMSIVTFLAVTYMGILDGFDRWIYYYVISIIALLMFFLRRWMLKRMQKHLEFLNDKNKK